MDSRKPITALRVSDLPASIHFFCTALGFDLDWQEAAVAAQVRPPGGLPLLLVGTGAPGIAQWMHDQHRELQPGQRLYMNAWAESGQIRERAVRHGAEAGPVSTESDGSTVLELRHPDGFLLSLWHPPQVPDAELIRRYADGPAVLDRALDGLAESDLDLVRAPGKWSIRQTVHHISDSEASSLVRILMALAEPGRRFNSNPYSQDRWVEGLDHAHRPVGPSVALIRAVRAHVAGLATLLPDALDRSVDTSLGGRATVRQMLAMLVSHIAGHAGQILETRRIHKI